MGRAVREKTRHVGVYERRYKDKQGKAATAFDITYKAEGRKVWECVGLRSEGMTAGLASRKRAAILEAKDAGELVGRGDIPTFAEAWKIYFDNHLAGKANVATDLGMFKRYLAKPLGNKPLNKITPLDIQSLKKQLEITPKTLPDTTNEAILKRREETEPKYLSPQSIVHAIGLVRRVYRKCIQWGLYSGRIPTVNVALPKADNRRERFLTEEEAQMLLDVLKKRSLLWHDISLVSLHTGLRLSEILNLQAQHVDVENGIIYVMDAKAGSRTAYMTEQVKTVFREGLKSCASAKIYVFRQASGQRIKHISSVYARVVDELFNEGVTDRRHKVVFHTLRHTFGSWLAQKGVPLYTIGELMGHSTLEMTQRYAKLSPDNKRDAVALLNNIIR